MIGLIAYATIILATAKRWEMVSLNSVWTTVMTLKLENFDSAEYLDNEESIQSYLSEAFASGDPKHVVRAIGIAARAKGMTELSRQTGIRREQLYQALSDNGNPTLQTLLPVLSALGLKLQVSSAHTA